MTIEDDVLKKMIGEYVKQQQVAQTKERICGQKPDVLGHLEKRLMAGEITEAEYISLKLRQKLHPES